MIVLFIRLSSWLQNRPISNEVQGSLSVLFKLTFVLLIGAMAFAGMKILGGFSTKFTENPEAMQLLVQGDFALNFWLGEIILAVALPLVLLLASGGGKRIGMYSLACLSSTVGIFITFYDLIIVGQLIPHFHQYNLFDAPRLYSYSPTLHEAIMVTGAISFFLAAFVVGELAFNSVSWRRKA
jgi:molybdopterin-containing oxidoreductase family membrane subunit